MSDLAQAAGLLLMAAALRGLAGYRDVDALVERVIASVRGTEGLDQYDLSRLQTWVRRWSAVHPEVRTFYRRALDAILSAEDAAAVETGIRCLLLDFESSGPVRGRLARLHLDLMASDPGRDLTRLEP